MKTDQEEKLIWSFSVANQWAHAIQMPTIKISEAVWYPRPDETYEEIKMVGFTEYFINKLKWENAASDYRLPF